MASDWLLAWQATHGPPAFRAALRPSSPRARIPPLLFQTAPNASLALSLNHRRMASWWTLNPQHSYHLFADEDATDFVARFCSLAERAAFARALVGAQRADLFRIFLLREAGASLPPELPSLPPLPLQLLSPHDSSPDLSPSLEPYSHPRSSPRLSSALSFYGSLSPS